MVGLFATEVAVLSSWDATSCVTNASFIGVAVVVGSAINGITGVDVIVLTNTGTGDGEG
jgi:hypothetical protein